jgi:hypothetical protein
MKKILVVLLLALFVFSFSACGSDDSDDDAEKEKKDDQETNDDEDTSDAPSCGNNMVEDGEVCDGGALACGEVDSSYTGGIALCKEDCSGYDVSDCKGGENNNGGDPESEVLCWDTYLCVSSCYNAEDKPACEAECVSKASKEGKDLYNTMMECVDANCSGAADPGECAQEKCAEQISACFNHFEPAAPGTCMAIFECQQKCPQNDQGCYQSCVDQGNAKGQQLYNDFVSCANSCGGDQSCVNEQCADQQNACLNDK